MPVGFERPRQHNIIRDYVSSSRLLSPTGSPKVRGRRGEILDGLDPELALFLDWTGQAGKGECSKWKAEVEREMGENLYLGLKEFLVERRGNRLAVRDVAKQLSEISNTQVSQDEVANAMRRLEADGMIQFNERNQSVFVRTGLQ